MLCTVLINVVFHYFKMTEKIVSQINVPLNNEHEKLNVSAYLMNHNKSKQVEHDSNKRCFDCYSLLLVTSERNYGINVISSA